MCVCKCLCQSCVQILIPYNNQEGTCLHLEAETTNTAEKETDINNNNKKKRMPALSALSNSCGKAKGKFQNQPVVLCRVSFLVRSFSQNRAGGVGRDWTLENPVSLLVCFSLHWALFKGALHLVIPSHFPGAVCVAASLKLITT